jgi:hypothetical protein
MAALLRVPRHQLRAANLLSRVDAVGTVNSERHRTNSPGFYQVTITRRDAPCVRMQLTVVDQDEDKLWLFSSAGAVDARDAAIPAISDYR